MSTLEGLLADEEYASRQLQACLKAEALFEEWKVKIQSDATHVTPDSQPGEEEGFETDEERGDEPACSNKAESGRLSDANMKMAVTAELESQLQMKACVEAELIYRLKESACSKTELLELGFDAGDRFVGERSAAIQEATAVNLERESAAIKIGHEPERIVDEKKEMLHGEDTERSEVASVDAELKRGVSCEMVAGECSEDQSKEDGQTSDEESELQPQFDEEVASECNVAETDLKREEIEEEGTGTEMLATEERTREDDLDTDHQPFDKAVSESSHGESGSFNGEKEDGENEMEGGNPGEKDGEGEESVGGEDQTKEELEEEEKLEEEEVLDDHSEVAEDESDGDDGKTSDKEDELNAMSEKKTFGDSDTGVKEDEREEEEEEEERCGDDEEGNGGVQTEERSLEDHLSAGLPIVQPVSESVDGESEMSSELEPKLQKEKENRHEEEEPVSEEDEAKPDLDEESEERFEMEEEDLSEKVSVAPEEESDVEENNLPAGRKDYSDSDTDHDAKDEIEKEEGEALQPKEEARADDFKRDQPFAVKSNEAVSGPIETPPSFGVDLYGKQRTTMLSWFVPKTLRESNLALREEHTQRMVLENLTNITQRENNELNLYLASETTSRRRAEGDAADLKLELKQSQREVEQLKERVKGLEESLQGTMILVRKLEQQSASSLLSRGGIDYMLEAKIASNRANEAEQKNQMLQVELLQSQSEVKRLLDQMMELNRDRSEMVSSKVHGQLIAIADEKAKEAEQRAITLQREIEQLKLELKGGDAMGRRMDSHREFAGPSYPTLGAHPYSTGYSSSGYLTGSRYPFTTSSSAGFSGLGLGSSPYPTLSDSLFTSTETGPQKDGYPSVSSTGPSGLDYSTHSSLTDDLFTRKSVADVKLGRDITRSSEEELSLKTEQGVSLSSSRVSSAPSWLKKVAKPTELAQINPELLARKLKKTHSGAASLLPKFSSGLPELTAESTAEPPPPPQQPSLSSTSLVNKQDSDSSDWSSDESNDSSMPIAHSHASLLSGWEWKATHGLRSQVPKTVSQSPGKVRKFGSDGAKEIVQVMTAEGVEERAPSLLPTFLGKTAESPKIAQKSPAKCRPPVAPKPSKAVLMSRPTLSFPLSHRESSTEPGVSFEDNPYNFGRAPSLTGLFPRPKGPANRRRPARNRQE